MKRVLRSFGTKPNHLCCTTYIYSSVITHLYEIWY